MQCYCSTGSSKSARESVKAETACSSEKLRITKCIKKNRVLLLHLSEMWVFREARVRLAEYLKVPTKGKYSGKQLCEGRGRMS